jgi:putative ABC transport system permease protein
LKIVRRLRSLFGKDRLERELDEELRFHLESQIDANLAQGMSYTEARYVALRSLGGIEQIKEGCRDARGVGFLEDFVRDVQLGLRLLWKSPGFTSVAVVTLVLGVGVSTAVFSVVDGVLLRPLPFPDSGRIVTIWNTYPQLGGERQEVSPPDFCDWREQSRSFAQLAAYERFSWVLGGEPDSLRLSAARVSGDFFAAMGLHPILGRPLLPADDHGGTHRVVVLSHRLWTSRFGADPSVVGRTVTLTGVDHAVVGVMPAGFRFPHEAELWSPLAYEPPFDPSLRRSVWLRTVARLKPGVTLAQAQSDVSAVAQRLEKQYPDTNQGRGAVIVSLYEHTVGDTRLALLVLMGAVGCVLLIACANVVNLLLARATGRQQELALRAALGARQPRLVRQLVTESALLGLLGGAGGVAVTWLSLAVLRGLNPASIPRLTEVRLDLRALAFALAVSLAAGVASGILPALTATRTDLNRLLKEGSRRLVSVPGRQRLRAGLVVVEVALAQVLLVGGGLLFQSFLHLSNVEPGFDPEGLLVSQFELLSERYVSRTARAAFYRQAVEQAAALPGVETAALSSTIPLHEVQLGYEFLIEGRPAPSLASQYPSAGYNSITPGYFRTMGIRLLSGRNFTDADHADSAPVTIINQAMALRFWPGESPLGRRIRIVTDESPPKEIVGVVGDVRQVALGAPVRSEIYLPYAQLPWRQCFLLLRSTAGPAGLAEAVRREFRAIDPGIALTRLRSMNDQASESLAPPRFRTILLGVFAALALTLAAVGVFGVLSYSVSQRTRDFAIRVALGAERRDILRLLISEGLLLVLTGVVLGLGISLAMTRSLSSLLFGILPTDPATYAVVTVLLSLVAVAACYWPSRRALLVDLAVTLRHE